MLCGLTSLLAGAAESPAGLLLLLLDEGGNLAELALLEGLEVPAAAGLTGILEMGACGILEAGVIGRVGVAAAAAAVKAAAPPPAAAMAAPGDPTLVKLCLVLGLFSSCSETFRKLLA